MLPNRAELAKTYDYDPGTGRFLVINRTHPRLKIGQLAGSFCKRTNRWYLSWKGVPVSMAICVWIWHTDEPPTSDVQCQDGDITNTRFENLVLRQSLPTLVGVDVLSWVRLNYKYLPESGELFRCRPLKTLVPSEGCCTLPGGRRAPVTHIIWALQKGEFPPTGTWIDHKNGDRQDNTWCNLRGATKSQNRANRVLSRTTGAKQLPNGRWAGVIKFKGKVHYSPEQFSTPEEAHEWFKQEHKKYWGDYSPFNCRVIPYHEKSRA